MTCDVALVAPYPRQASSGAVPSGVAAYSEKLANALADEGLSVHVVAPEVSGEPQTCRVGRVTIERAHRKGPWALPGAAAAALRTGAPVVHLQYETFLYGGPESVPGLVPALAALRLRARGPVVTLHQVVDPATVDRGFTRLHRVRVPAGVAKVALSGLQGAVSRLAAVTVVHEHGFRAIVPRAVVVPHGLDMAEGMFDRERASKVKASLGLRPDRLTALCFGFLAPYKGLESALGAAALEHDAFNVVVAGGSHPRMAGAGYAEELERSYGDRARFVGYVPDADVASWFRAADVVLLPYPRPFASSGPLAQALGFGTPVLCSPALASCVGAPDELVAPTNPEGLASRLRELASDQDDLRALGAATRTLAADRTWTDVARRHMTLYEEVIDACRTPRRRVRPGQPW